MNIIVLHGDDIVKSRVRLEKFIDTAKNRGWELVKIGGEKKSLAETLSSQSLFEKERLFIIEDISTLGKTDLTWLAKKGKTLKANLVIYHAGVLSQTFLKALPTPDKLEEYKLPRIIFDFLNAFYPGNSKRALKLFHEVMATEPAEFVFALLGRHLHDLYLAKISPSSLSYPAWRVGRLTSQSAKFTQESLEDVISHLARIDIEAKTGGPLLSDSLDLAIITKLQ
jgi:DNA polymerase III delta subunit